MHKVQSDRIVEATTGKEVMWRGAGGSYLLHGSTLQESLDTWKNLVLPHALNFGLNTMRLAFAFPWDTIPMANPRADVIDFANMDAVIDLLAQNGIKSILDYHGSQAQMFKKPGYDGSVGLADVGDPVNPQLLQSWYEVAEHYSLNENVVAYEVYNEPSCAWGGEPGVAFYRSTPRRNAEGYNAVSRAIRVTDLDHILVWETPSYYIANFWEISDLMLSNVVYTAHRWWTNKVDEIETYGPVELSRMVTNSFVNWRHIYDIPIWLGEFGGPGGGSSSKGYDPTDLYWRIAEELFYRSEEQVIGWNIWMGNTSPTIERLLQYEPLFPLKIFNSNLIRQPWPLPAAKLLKDYITASKGIDKWRDEYSLELWHNGDYVTFAPGIVLKIVTSCSATGQSIEQLLTVTAPTTITLHENTPEFPGDWNIQIYSVGYIPRQQPYFLVPLGVLLAILGYCLYQSN